MILSKEITVPKCSLGFSKSNYSMTIQALADFAKPTKEINPSG
jgi:hypothetical protein